MHSKRRAILAAAVSTIPFLTAGNLYAATAATVTWDGGGSDNLWSTASNWSADALPTVSPSNTILFNQASLVKANNTADLAGAFSTLQYRQNTSTVSGTTVTDAFITTIDRGTGLTVNGTDLDPVSNTTTIGNSNFIVMPTDNALALGQDTGSYVKFNSSGTGSNGLTILNRSVMIGGRPGSTSNNGFSSFGIVDARDLDSFYYSQAVPATGNNTVFNVGFAASGVGGETGGAYWGELWLPKNGTATIISNRIVIGGQNGAAGTNAAGPANRYGIMPVSKLMLGSNTSIDPNNVVTPANSIAGVVYVGSDALPGNGSGAIMFQPGLTGSPAASLMGGASAAGNLEIGRHRLQTSRHVFGVVDGTSASGTMEGELTGGFGSWLMSHHSPGVAESGGGFGMLSMDKGNMQLTGGILLSATTSAPTRGTLSLGMINLGVKGAATDTGGGIINAGGDLTLSSRVHNSSGTISVAMLNLANNADFTARRVFVGNNTNGGIGTGTDMPVGSVVGIVNLGGGTLTTGQVQAGNDTVQAAGGITTRLINFDGGTLKVRAATVQAQRDAFMQGHTAANIYDGGGTIDTNGQDIIVGQALVAPAGQGVSQIDVVSGGSKYRVAPIVNIKRGAGDTTGVGATAVARINPDGTLNSVIVLNPGTDYTVAPIVELIANAGTAAPIGVVAPATWGNYVNTLTPYDGTAAVTTATLAGNISGGFTKTGTGILTLNGINTYTGATTSNAGTLVLGQSSLVSSAMNATGGNIEMATNGNNKLKTKAISFSGTGAIQMNNNDLLLDYTGASQASAVRGYVINGLNATGSNEIRTTATVGAFSTTLAVLDNADLGLTDWEGVSIDTDTVIGKFTFFGDANVDGTVDNNDYFVVDGGLGDTSGKWIAGDMNLDGITNSDDYFVIDGQLGATGAALPAVGVAAVPEPGTFSLLGLAAAGLLRRRRRQS